MGTRGLFQFTLGGQNASACSEERRSIDLITAPSKLLYQRLIMRGKKFRTGKDKGIKANLATAVLTTGLREEERGSYTTSSCPSGLAGGPGSAGRKDQAMQSLILFDTIQL